MIMACGVYRVLLPDGRYYVGHSRKCDQRWRGHLRELVLGTHYCKPLQKGYNVSGYVVFELLERCDSDREVLLEREQHHIDEAGPLLLNFSRVAAYTEPTPAVKRLRSKSAKQQHAAGKFGNVTWTQEGRARVNEATSRRFRGIKQPPEAVAKMRKSCKERWTPELREQQRQRANLQFQKRQARIFGREVPT